MAAELLTITFLASLTDKGQCIGFYDDGCGRLVLQTDSSQFNALANLGAFGRKSPLKVTVQIMKPSTSQHG
jgi:hypothetical protein